MEKLIRPEPRVCKKCGKDFIAKRGTYGLYCSCRCSSSDTYDGHLKNYCASWTGKKHTDEWKKMMSEKLTGRTYSPETIAKMSSGAKNRKTPHPMLGKKHSEETKQKISNQNKGRKHPSRKAMSDETRRKISEARKGMPSKLKGRVGKKASVEVRRKMSESHRLFWKDKKLPDDYKRLINGIRDSIDMKIWREQVFGRDSYTCCLCGNKKSGTLRAHHLQSFKKYPHRWFDVSNGMTLCVSCHQLVHSRKPVFMVDSIEGEVIKNNTITVAHA